MLHSLCPINWLFVRQYCTLDYLTIIIAQSNYQFLTTYSKVKSFHCVVIVSSCSSVNVEVHAYNETNYFKCNMLVEYGYLIHAQ